VISLETVLCYHAPMEKKDLLHLATLSRIKINDEEAQGLLDGIESVLAYVSAVNSITADVNLTKKVGPVYNVFREDIVTNEGGTYTDAILKEAPSVKGRHLKVKKILQID
jgi:aspartyl/glutamyl-tRNA(Asn/Gln) amidotransferase C subunit